ncbi:carboxylesterase family protein [Olivibacter ginsenosidimutans]|uniref:Carboxylic ester hydrolase n=1 Tax=Olivibacter ginsenosidimutans TaxID=1176537 RepID=A0ABP9BRY2_9SPHI
MKTILGMLIVLVMQLVYAQNTVEGVHPRIKVSEGTLEGQYKSGIASFKGIPFAAPPVGKFRWREPQPVQPWQGVRKADRFGPRAMQRPIFDDMQFRSDGMSEDCLYLNVWTPAKTFKEKLPVLVYFYGGGLIAGDGSEFRYDGESMARKGIVTVTVNYRLNIFGFFSHPELTSESPYHASGNYGFLDQLAALKWVQQNIGAFGGDPTKVTIAGESAGSYSVSAQMTSPLAKKLFRGAIGESGALLDNHRPRPSLAEAEQNGLAFAKAVQANSLAELRALPAEELLAATAKFDANFSATIDGYFFPDDPVSIFKRGAQAKVPLLVGWNTEESNYRGLLGDKAPNIANFNQIINERFGKQAAQLLQVYKPQSDEEVKQVATDFAGDQFIAYGTWRWSDLHSQTGNQPVYRYHYARPRPAMRHQTGEIATGAVHSAEIEYALGNLPTNRVYNWQPEDYQVSAIMQAYFVNFIKTTDPNGLGLPVWPRVKAGEPAQLMHIDVETKSITEQHRDRYLLLEKLSDAK